MHELSLADNILRVSLAKAKEHNLKQITKVNLCVGMHFYLEEKGLKECWPLVTKDSIAKGSELMVKLKGDQSLQEYFIESIEGE